MSVVNKTKSKPFVESENKKEEVRSKLRDIYANLPVATAETIAAFDWKQKGIFRLDLPEACAKYSHIKLKIPENTEPYARVGWFPSGSKNDPTIYVLFVGTAEAIEKHTPAIELLNRLGRSVVVYEPPGQGGSGRFLNNPFKIHALRKGFDFWRDCQKEFIESKIFAQIGNIAKNEMGGCDVVALPYSIGGLIFAQTMLAWPKLATKFSHVCYVNPGVAFRSIAESMVVRYVRTAGAFITAWAGGREEYLPGHDERDPATKPFEKSNVGSDKFKHERLCKFYGDFPEFTMRGSSYGWIYEATRALSKLWFGLNRHAIFGPARPNVLTAVIASGRDKLGIKQHVELFAKMLKADLISLPTATHEPTQEPDVIMNSTIRAVRDWIDGLRKGYKTPVVEFRPNRAQSKLRKKMARNPET